jgi:hypothetical protein
MENVLMQMHLSKAGTEPRPIVENFILVGRPSPAACKF